MQTKVMEEEDDDEDNMSTTKGNRGIRSERERESWRSGLSTWKYQFLYDH